MYKQIYKYIKKYDNIVIARHIGVDPDAMASQVALRDSIKLILVFSPRIYTSSAIFNCPYHEPLVPSTTKDSFTFTGPSDTNPSDT